MSNKQLIRNMSNHLPPAVARNNSRGEMVEVTLQQLSELVRQSTTSPEIIEFITDAIQRCGGEVEFEETITIIEE